MNHFQTVRDALTAAANLIAHQYTGTSLGMTALQDASDDCLEALNALAAIEADHYSAADMADAQAKAFRAGVASVQQGEPVAWRDPSNSDPGQGCTYDKARREKWPHIYKQPLFAAPVAQQPQAEDVEVPNTFKLPGESDDQWLDRITGAAPQQAEAVPSDVVRDAERLNWLLMQVSGKEFRRIGVEYSGNCQRADIDAALAQQKGASHE